jgi:nickel transport protein
MKMNSTYLLGFLLFVSGTPMATRAPAAPVVHGIRVQVSAGVGVHVAWASYEEGTPVVDGDVAITAPGSEEAWQTGRTDPSGRFAFFPDAPGTWTIRVDDGRGHRAQATVEVGAREVAAGPEVEASAGPEGEARLWRLLTGLGLIAGVTGVAYGYTARRKGADAE